MQEAQVLLSEMLRHCGGAAPCVRPRAELPVARPPRPRDAPAVHADSAGLRPINGSMPWFPAVELAQTPAKKAQGRRQRTPGASCREEDRPEEPPEQPTPPTASAAVLAVVASEAEDAPPPPDPAEGEPPDGGGTAPAQRPKASSEASDAEFCRLLSSALAESSL
mmetsp:Transcript_144326/g.350410  ORF Transcript_144326/g.350410 Transcript_144326/m.350410 type:complete len:165 (-) Transcript_144326:130-624(-)